MEPEAGSEDESRTGTMSNEEAEWLLRVLPVLEAERRLNDMVSSSALDWASRTTWRTTWMLITTFHKSCTYINSDGFTF